MEPSEGILLDMGMEATLGIYPGMLIELELNRYHGP